MIEAISRVTRGDRGERIKLGPKLRKEFQEILPEGLKELLNSNVSITVREKQVVFNVVIDTKHEKLEEDQVVTMKKDYVPKDDTGALMSYDQIKPDGSFNLYFSDDLIGLVYIFPLEIGVKAKGTVSTTLFADDEGLASQNPKEAKSARN